MHTLLAREHNRAAKALSQVNPHWDDETVFQEARRIIIAEIQHVTYNEFLPILLGKDVMEKFGLLLEKHVSVRKAENILYSSVYAKFWTYVNQLFFSTFVMLPGETDSFSLFALMLLTLLLNFYDLLYGILTRITSNIFFYMVDLSKTRITGTDTTLQWILEC